MEQKKRERKRWLAIIAALGILLFSAFGNIFFDSLKINRLESQLIEKSLNEQLAGFAFDDQIIQGSDFENRITVVSIDGVIGGSGAPAIDNLFNNSETTAFLDAVLEDPTVKGLILNVNSPGGGVYESAKIWEKVQEIKEKTDISIYTAMGEVAASGGYYVAAPSDKIFAAEETITGSIGVISDYINISELEEKLGIKHEVIKSGEHKDIGSANREMTDEEREINQQQVDEFFDKFVDVIVDGRQMTEDNVRELADGQVYTGKQAYENGLVDELGYFEDTLEAMIEDLGLEDPEVFEKGASTPGWLQFFAQAVSPNKSESPTNMSFELEAFKYIEKNQAEGNLPKFYYMYGGV